jgi:putative tryptophan/tyrosine transport system substrate-binding protein
MATHRRLLLTLGGAAAVAPAWVWSQPSPRTQRIGWISLSASFDEPYNVAFVERLAELGFVEGRNLTIERRHVAGVLEKLPEVSAELGRLNCDAYFGGGSEATLGALAQASREAPIVFIAVDFDPVVTGDVTDLARPGGRLTGMTALQSTLPAKRLELLRELLPRMRKVAVFTNEQTSAQLALARGTTRRLGLTLHVVDFRRPPFDYAAGFADAVQAKADAVFVLGSGLFVPGRRLIPELALKARLPTVFHQAQWVEAGGLMSYGFSFTRMWRRGAEMMAKVLAGTPAGTIPMEQPPVYELVLNGRTARTLGIEIPKSMQVRADRVIG